MNIMNKTSDSTKDGWDKLEIIGKSLAGILVSAAIAFYSINSGKNQFNISEENRKAQIIVQTMGNREAASADLKAKMFSALMEYYLKERDDPATQRIIVELIGLNFQEHLRLKPLFEKLEQKLGNNTNELEKLRKSARNMARIEIDNIVGNNGAVCRTELALGQTLPMVENCELPISLTLLEINQSSIRVSTQEGDTEGFGINYYDMPLVDNTKLGDFTYSVILSDINQKDKKATINLVILPEHFYSARHSLHFDQFIGDWMFTDVNK